MKKRLFYIILLLTSCLFAKGQANGGQYVMYGDTIQGQVIFDCAITYNGIPLNGGCEISVEAVYDTFSISGSGYLSKDSILIIDLVGDSLINLADSTYILTFSFEDTIRKCSSYNIEYTVNPQESTSETLIIDNFDVSDHYFTYYGDVFCKKHGVIVPDTDIPFEDVEVVSPTGLYISQRNEIITDSSDAGTHSIHVLTEYCLEVGADTSNIVIKEISGAIPDTINFCADSIEQQMMNSGFEFYLLNDEGFNTPLSVITLSGDYLVRETTGGFCTEAIVAYVSLGGEFNLLIEQEYLCEKTVVRVAADVAGNYTYHWSNGQNVPELEITESEVLTINVSDHNGCSVSETVEVEYVPFEVNSIAIEKEDSDCWQDGKVYINEINASRGELVYDYVLVNTINGNRVNNLLEVPEGIFKVEIAEASGCVVTYPEEITILQNCLNDYPVFTPDNDGIEDEYFIPHTGIVKIFNRYGVMLNEINTPAYWDGTDASGNQMPMGNYVMLTEDGRIVNITIVR